MAKWYEFKFTSLGFGEILLYNYKYVLAADTTEEKPEEMEKPSTECTCEDPAVKLGLHKEDCPRRQHIETLIKGSAEEIYKNWESYDESV